MLSYKNFDPKYIVLYFFFKFIYLNSGTERTWPVLQTYSWGAWCPIPKSRNEQVTKFLLVVLTTFKVVSYCILKLFILMINLSFLIGSFGWYLCFVQKVYFVLRKKMFNSPPSCLVPGAGLGRLALEISCLGNIHNWRWLNFYFHMYFIYCLIFLIS